MRRSEAGTVLILTLVLVGFLIAVAALLVDVGVALYVKQEAVKAAELSARRGVAEMYVPDYQPLTAPAGDAAAVPGLDDDKWWSQFLETPARASVQALGASLTAGWTSTFGLYSPNIQLNDANAAGGDIRLGNWTKAAGGPFSFAPSPGTINTNAGLARAAQVSVQRILAPAIPGVSDGGNPVPVVFAGFFGVTETQQRSVVTAKIDPAAVLGAGALVPMQGGATAVTGTFPIAFRHNGIVRRIRPNPQADLTVRDWVVGNNPAVMVRIRVTADGTAAAGGNVNYAASTYFVSFPSTLGGAPNERIARRLKYLGQRPVAIGGPGGAPEPPPLCSLGQLLSGPGQGDGGGLSNGHMNQLQTALELNNRTWTVPVVVNGGADNRRCAGFLRLYVEAARRVSAGGSSYYEFDLRLASSACARNSGPFPTLGLLTPPTAPSAAVLGVWNDVTWTTDAVDGLRSGPRPFGVACAVVSADY